MAKTIKFNLICDDKPVRTIEDLQDNFSIEDVLKYYQNGLLLRWLKVRGYEEEYEKVSQINESETLEIVKELIKIFDVETDDKKVEEGVYSIQFFQERNRRHEEYRQENYMTQRIIADYQSGFNQLINIIVYNPYDVAKIKAAVNELMSGFKWAMDLYHEELFWKLREISPLAIMCFLMNDEARQYYLPMPINPYFEAYMQSDNARKVDYENNNARKRRMYDAICRMLKTNDFVSKLGENLHVFAGETAGYWKDLESKGKKYMIISMELGDFVRSAGVQGGDLNSTDIENKFVILDGIDYKSNNSNHQLCYMEV